MADIFLEKKIPDFLKKYFWDIDFGKLDIRSHPHYVLSRILEYGDEDAIAWMRENFTRDDIAYVLFHLRTVSPMSANFWALVFGIDRKKILCLKKHYLEIRKRHWPY
jgi:hypothetical protein